MLKIITLLTLTRLSCIKINKNEVGTKNSDSIDSSKSNDKIANLLNIIKKKKTLEEFSYL